MAQSGKQALGQAGLEHHGLARLALLDHVVQQLFQSGVQGDDRKAVLVVQQALADHATELGADQGGEQFRVLGA